MPIIPTNGLKEISKDFSNIINNTNLITPYNPDYDEGNGASIKSIEFLKKILKEKYRYGELFNQVKLKKEIVKLNRRN
ncbi:MAG: hypothetical protein MH321_03135 [Leptospiraceae bacterium]|nr:hypothetical protein [Leptospiraceae bacterium]